VTHHDSWHDDTSGAGAGRLAGFSLNLSRETYRGGTFQIREKARPDDVVEVENTGAGDAFLFRIAPAMQHRVLPVDRFDGAIGIGDGDSERDASLLIP